jgi:hypothetical protein
MMPLRESSRPPRTSVRFSASGAAGWSLALLLVQGVAAGVVRPRGSTGPIDFVSFGVVSLVALLVVLFGVVRVHGPDASLREVLGFEESPLSFPPAVSARAALVHRVSVALLALVVGVALVGVDSAVDAYFTSRDPAYGDDIAKLYELLEAPTTRARAARLFGLGVVQPLAELAFYFGVVFGGLRRPRSRGLAAGLTLVFFVLHASDIRAAPVRLLLGLPLLFARMGTGTVVASAVGTVAFNALEVMDIGRSAKIVGGSPTLWAAVAVGGIAGLAVLALQAKRWRLGEFADRLDLRA